MVLFVNRPFEDALTFATHGLSDHKMTMPDGRDVRLELLFACWRDQDRGAVASFLGSFADSIVGRHKPPLRGEVVGPGETILEGTSMNSVYVCLPAVFEKTLAVYPETTPSTVVVWIIPIYRQEAEYVKTHGWKAFEDLLEKTDPDLLDVTRFPVVDKGHGG